MLFKIYVEVSNDSEGRFINAIFNTNIEGFILLLGHLEVYNNVWLSSLRFGYLIISFK